MKFKSKAELLKMTAEEIAGYVKSIDEESAEFAEWCGNDLADALDQLGISDEMLLKR